MVVWVAPVTLTHGTLGIAVATQAHGAGCEVDVEPI